MQISPEVMHEDVASIYKQQKEIGYPSTFIEGEKDCMTYMQGLFSDWQAGGITSVLHEKKGGYANSTRSIYGLAKKADNGGWNKMEILAIGNRIRLAVNGQLVADWSDPMPESCGEGPIGLQLHSNPNTAQEVQFRGLVLSENPKEEMATVEKK